MGQIEIRNQRRRDERKQAAEIAADKKNGIDRQPTADIPDPDPKDLESVITWYFSQILFLINRMKKESSAARLRALNSAMDSFSKLRRLSADTAELQELKKQLDELKMELQRDSQIKRVK